MTNGTNDSDSTKNQPNERDDEKKQSETKDKIPTMSGDPGRTPGSAEGDEETIDADIRQKEREGKL